MPASRIEFATPATAPRWLRWCVYAPPARIVWFVLLMAALGYAAHLAIAAAGWTAKGAPALLHALALLGAETVPALLAYVIVVKAIERRRIRELAPHDLPAFGTGGLLFGALLFSAVTLVLWLAGSYHVIGVNPRVDWVPGVLGAGIGAGVGEEIMLRGVIYRIVEEGLGSSWALLISALLFGAMHLANPGATWWSALAIAIEAGLLLALVYAVTRSLWACIGLHAAWNICEGTLYGLSVSGTGANGLLVSRLTGPDWLSGGKFGAEASVVAVLVCGTASLLLALLAIRRGRLVTPAWRRRALATQSA